MGNTSGTKCEDKDVIESIVKEKNRWHETMLDVQKHHKPDMGLINDMLKDTFCTLRGYLLQVPYAAIQTDTDPMVAEIEEELKRLKVEHKQLQNEKEAITYRLSKVIGEKLVKDNPNISDLSDKNRPTKLGEIYIELYDNEWTDGYDALTNAGYKENGAIETLSKTLKACFEFCHTKADDLLESTAKAANVLFQEVHEQMKDQKRPYKTLTVMPKEKTGPSQLAVSKSFFFETLILQCKWKSTAKSETKANLDMTQTIYHPRNFDEELKKVRKQMSEVLIPVVQNAFLKTYWDDECIPALKPFIKKCLFLCWMMVVQGPPMCFDWNTRPGSLFDANMYKLYTVSGTVVDFVVWPTLFLHKDGPIIAKGVAQPSKEKAS